MKKIVLDGFHVGVSEAVFDRNLTETDSYGGEVF